MILEANNYFFNYKIPRDVLSVAIAQRPDLVARWLEPIQGEQNETVRKVIRVSTLFYETLCSVLLERSHPRAIELYRYLNQNESQIILKDAQTNTRYLDYALFQALPSESLKQEWLHQLENCHSDTELRELAIVAQLGQGESWLLSLIEQQLQSSAPGDFSQAVTMLGFLEADDAINHLKNLAISQPDTWRKRLVDISMERWQRNLWAKHWFRKFLNQGDRVMAWRGFRLFLQCVDQRFWLWKEQLITYASSASNLSASEHTDVQPSENLNISTSTTKVDKSISNISASEHTDVSTFKKAKSVNPDYTRTMVYLPKKMHKKLKAIALDEEREMSSIVEELIETWLSSGT